MKETGKYCIPFRILAVIEEFYVSLQDKRKKIHGRFYIDDGQCDGQ